jgi:8-oxo-dGTP pyrophosphatase MutT (NUDIX family)
MEPVSNLSSPPVTPRLAAAVTLLRTREGRGVEVFMVRRHIRSDFAPDVYVFPGGSVQPSDSETERTAGLCAPAGEGPTALGTGVRVAAVRELFEEAGVLLASRRDAPWPLDAEATQRFAHYRAEVLAGRTTLASIAAREGVRLAADALVYWAHWITPEVMAKRFDTHFFLAEERSGQMAVHDDVEVTASAWVAPEAALAAFERDEFPLVFATVRQLRELTGFSSAAAALAHFAGTTPRTIKPVASRTADGEIIVQIPGDPSGPQRL